MISLNRGWNKKRFLTATVAVLAIHTAVIIFFGMQKVAFHEDEYITYAIASAHQAINPYGPIQETTGIELLYHFVLTDENRFQFGKVADIQAEDVHPPLYYLVLHFVMSLFPYRFYKWFGISLNACFSLVSCAGIMFFIGRLDKSKHRYFLALFGGLLYAVHPMSISSVMFNRMYAMSVMWTVLYMDVWILLLQNLMCNWKHFAVLTLCGAAVCYLAFLTHYFCLYNFFFLTLGFCFYVLYRKLCYREKCFLRMVLYGLAMVAAIGFAVLTFPTSIQQIFFGEQGEGAFYGLFHISTAQMLDLFMPILNYNFFAGMMYPVIAILVISLIVRTILRIRDNQKIEGDVSAAVISIGFASSIIIVWLLCKTSLFLGDDSSRYFYSIAAIILPLMVYCIGGTILQAAELMTAKRAGRMIAYAVF